MRLNARTNAANRACLSAGDHSLVCSSIPRERLFASEFYLLELAFRNCRLANRALRKDDVTVIDLDSDRATAVFRIFQETLTNIVRHAEATEVNIQLREEADKLILEVQDNGRGLTGRELSGAKSLGLLGMRERATMLDGEVNIISRHGKGTTVGVRIPLQRSTDQRKK